MSSGKIYLDSCIFIAYEHKKDDRHNVVAEAIESLEKLDVEVYASDWALTELVKSLVKDYNYPREKAIEISDRYKKKSKIGDLPITWLEVGSEDKYSFEDFFEYIRNQLIENKDVHIADAIHSLVMSNNDIDIILTTDKDFDALKTVTSLDPNALRLIRPKAS